MNQSKLKLILAIAFVAVFIVLAVLTLSGTFSGFETWAADLMAQSRTQTLTSWVTIITYLGSFPVLCVLTVLLLIIPQTRKKLGYPAALAIIISALLNIILKDIFMRIRPDGMLVQEAGFSFPSGHAQNSTAFFVALVLLVLNNIKSVKIKLPLVLVCVIIPLIVGWSRLYLGVHYAGDVLSGWVLGASVALFIDVLWQFLNIKLKKYKKLHNFLFESEKPKDINQ